MSPSLLPPLPPSCVLYTYKVVQDESWGSSTRNTTVRKSLPYARYKALLFLPPANEVWGKVMFLHLCVILFTVGCMMSLPVWLPDPMLLRGGVSIQKGVTPSRGHDTTPHWYCHLVAVTKAGGTHLTGMHTCFYTVLTVLISFNKNAFQ